MREEGRGGEGERGRGEKYLEGLLFDLVEFFLVLLLLLLLLLFLFFLLVFETFEEVGAVFP